MKRKIVLKRRWRQQELVSQKWQELSKKMYAVFKNSSDLHSLHSWIKNIIEFVEPGGIMLHASVADQLWVKAVNENDPELEVKAGYTKASLLVLGHLKWPWNIQVTYQGKLVYFYNLLFPGKGLHIHRWEELRTIWEKIDALARERENLVGRGLVSERELQEEEISEILRVLDIF